MSRIHQYLAPNRVQVCTVSATSSDFVFKTKLPALVHAKFENSQDDISNGSGPHDPFENSQIASIDYKNAFAGIRFARFSGIARPNQEGA
jgi:hypothetical protein